MKRHVWAVAALVVASSMAGCGHNRIFRKQALQRPIAATSSARAVEKSPAPAETTADEPASKRPLAMARILERRGQIDNAEAIYRQVMASEPNNPVPYHRMGVNRAREGRFGEADRFFTTAQKFSPSDPELLNNIGYSLYLQHRLEEAEQYLRTAMRLAPKAEHISNNLALVLGDQGRHQESVAMFGRAGTKAEALANAAFVDVQAGEFDRAKQQLIRALSIDNRIRPAAEVLAQIAEMEEGAETLHDGKDGPAKEVLAASEPARARSTPGYSSLYGNEKEPERHAVQQAAWEINATDPQAQQPVAQQPVAQPAQRPTPAPAMQIEYGPVAAQNLPAIVHRHTRRAPQVEAAPAPIEVVEKTPIDNDENVGSATNESRAVVNMANIEAVESKSTSTTPAGSPAASAPQSVAPAAMKPAPLRHNPLRNNVQPRIPVQMNPFHETHDARQVDTWLNSA